MKFSELFNVMNFGDSPRMSSYLLAFVIGNFKTAMEKTMRGIPVRSYETYIFMCQVSFLVLEIIVDYFWSLKQKILQSKISGSNNCHSRVGRLLTCIG
jgi:hypothetical protein